MTDCECPPCPGRGYDGHGMNHCAECCFGSLVIADIDCPIHGEAAMTPDDDATPCEDCGNSNTRCPACASEHAHERAQDERTERE